MTQIFRDRVKTLQTELHKNAPSEAHIKNRMKWTISLVMVNMMIDQLQKYDNVYFQHRTLENFANFHKDPNIKQCWTENEWQQWHKELRLLIQQLPPLEYIALAA